jgi:hypothetical protein
MYGSPLIWSCAVALASPSTNDSKILHGLAQHVIARSDVLSIDLLALESLSITNMYVCTYLILCFALTGMLTSSRMGSNRSSNGTNPTLNSQSHAHNATRISKLPPMSYQPSGLYALRILQDSSSVCSDSRTPPARRISCLRNLYVSSLIVFPDNSLSASAGGRFTDIQQ